MATLLPSQKEVEEKIQVRRCLHRRSRDLTGPVRHYTTARQALKSLLPVGSDVTLRFKATDRYGRSVEEVICNRSNINQSLVEFRNAFVYSQ